MTPQARIIAALVTLLCWLASLALCAWWFYGAGQDHEIAGQAEIKKAIQETKDSAAEGAANAIAKASANSTKVVTQIKTVTRTVPVYRSAECVHDQRVFDNLNSQLRGSNSSEGSMP